MGDRNRRRGIFLSEAEIAGRLAALPGWQRRRSASRRTAPGIG